MLKALIDSHAHRERQSLMITSEQIAMKHSPIFDFQTPILCMGSCFAENIEKMLGAMGFNILPNEWGTHYNTYSIIRTVERIAMGQRLTKDDLWEDDGGFFTLYYSHIGRFANPSDILTHFHRMEKAAHENLLRGELFILTLGLTEIYVDGERGFISTNLNGYRPPNLKARNLTFRENYEAVQKFYRTLKEINPKYQVVLTVSPVILTRTYRDQHRFVSNSASKATLRAVANEICEDFSDIHYFPAYDIVSEEIRDWSSYLADRIHVAPVTVAKIMIRFIRTFFNNRAGIDIGKFEKIIEYYVEILDHLEKQDYSEKAVNLSEKLLAGLKEIGSDQIAGVRPVYAHTIAVYYRASFLKKLERLRESEEEFRILLAYLSGYQQYHALNYRNLIAGANFHLGEIALLNGNREDAAKFFKQCVSLVPEHRKAVTYLNGLQGRAESPLHRAFS